MLTITINYEYNYETKVIRCGYNRIRDGTTYEYFNRNEWKKIGLGNKVLINS